MTKEEEEANREKQRRQAEARHTREAETRPDAIHRAIHFLLQQQAINNPDTTTEARHHMDTLDRELANVGTLPADEEAGGENDATKVDTVGPALAERRSRRFSK